MSLHFQIRISFILNMLACVLSYRILVMTPLPSKSHYILGKGIADILYNRGHEITLVSSFPSKNTEYREINAAEDQNDTLMETGFEMSKDTVLGTIIELDVWVPFLMKEVLDSRTFKKILTDKNEKFDLVIMEYFLNEAYIGLGVKFDCPVIILSPVSPMNPITRDTGNPISPSTVPNVFLSFPSKMSLAQRVINVAMTLFAELEDWFIHIPSQASIYESYFPDEAARVPYEDLKKKVALMLINTHPSFGVARPLLPNAVEISGFHIGDTQPLPEDLKKIMDEAKHGVIFFSMGSNLKSSQLPEAQKNDILRALGKLKQTVVWKFEADLPGKPNNVIIRSWLPQTSILAHPNVRLFISHGGLLSCTEAAAAGVPLLAIPIFGDQHYNAKATQERGNGVMLSYSNLTETSFTWALQELFNNPKYEENAKSLYRSFNDRPMSPRDLVSFYTEHVIRTGGAPHLTPPRLSLWSSLLLDVALVMILPPLALLAITYLLCKKLCCRRKTQPITQHNKKNN